jgi:hypothetical protein
VNTALIRVAGLAVYVGLGMLLLETDRSVRFVGRNAQWLWNKARCRHAPLIGFDDRWLTQRDQIRCRLGRDSKWVLRLVSKRLGFGVLARSLLHLLKR